MTPIPIHVLRKLIKIVVLLASISCRTAPAEPIGAPATSASSANTADIAPPVQTTRWSAPVGHRQPRVRDVPSENASDIGRISDEDRAIDRRLIICRGC